MLHHGWGESHGTAQEQRKNTFGGHAAFCCLLGGLLCLVSRQRINYTAALTAIVADGVFSKPHAGFIGTVYFFCYGAGQIFSGILGDRVSPYKMIGTGLAGTVCANIIMPLCSGQLHSHECSVGTQRNSPVDALDSYTLYNIEYPARRAAQPCVSAHSVVVPDRQPALLCDICGGDKIRVVAFCVLYPRRNNNLRAGLLVHMREKRPRKSLGKGEKPSLPVHENTGEKISLSASSL